MKEFFRSLLPIRLQFIGVGLLQLLTKCKQIHYSQNGEDILLSAYFPYKNNGFYVDVGAHHPYRLSNTQLLFERGWSGINIDPNPDTIKLFDIARSKDKNICLGVGSEVGELTYYRFTDPAVNTFSNAEAEKYRQKPWINELDSISVPIKTLKSVLDTYLTSDKTLDFLNVDVEGLDLDVLRSNDWTKYRPTYVAVEEHGFSLSESAKSDVWNFMKDQQYELIDKVKFTLIFKDTQVKN